MGHRHRRQQVRLERGCSKNRRVRDRQSARVNESVRARRLAAIPRVANGRAGQRRIQQQGEGCVEETPAHIEMRHRRHARDGAVAIRRARRRRDEILQQAAAIDTVGIIIPLLRVLRRELRQRHARRIRVEQGEVIPERIQPEIRVEPLASPRCLAILLRGEDHEILSRRDVRRGERPFARVIPVIRQRIAGEVHRGRTEVVNLNPVLQLVVLILQPVRADGRGQEFVDAQARQPRARIQRVTRQRPARQRVGHRREIADVVIRGPGHRHRAVRRLRKSEAITATRQHREPRRWRAIDQKVCCIHSGHQFRELHIDLRELPDRHARLRRQRGNRGRCAVHQRVLPARRRSRFIEAIGGHIQIENRVVRLPRDGHLSVERLRLQRYRVGRARTGQAVGRSRAIDEQILEADPRHRLTERDRDIGECADGARRRDHALNHRRRTSLEGGREKEEGRRQKAGREKES